MADRYDQSPLSGLKKMFLRLATFLPMASAIDVFLNYTGDLMLGALVPVHQRAEPNGAGCGPIQLEFGVQTLEAMLYTVDRINAEPTLLPGIRLGLLVYDSCDNPAHALEQSLDLVKGFIGHLSMMHNDSGFSCSDGGKPVFRDGTDQVVAVIGGLSSTVTIQLATLLHMFKVPQVSYMSTSATLSDKALYPFFFRTVPSDVYQAHAMLEFLRQMNWTYVGVVYSDTDYGRHGWDMLTSLAANYSVCFATPAHRLRSGNRNDAAVAFNSIRNNTELRVVILFTERSPEVEDIIHGVLQSEVAARLTWVLPDAWDGLFQQAGASSPSRLLAGSVAIQQLDRSVSGFDNYFLSLGLDHQKVNPWFAEFWKAYFGCTTLNTSTDECVDVGQRVSDVRGALPLRQASYLHFVRDAIWAVAKALDDMHTAYCGKGVHGLCPGMRHVKGVDLRERLMRVQFKDESGQDFRFEDGRDGPPRYSVMQYQRVADRYEWVKTGNYTLDASGNRPRLILDKRIQKWFNSSCTPTCQQSYIKVRWREGCCWGCRPCAEYQYVVDEWTCEECPIGFKPSSRKTRCVLAPDQEISYSHPWAMVAMAIASFGVVSTLLVVTVFWRHRDTPVVKASGREVSALLLFAELCSFLVTFVMVATPTDVLCGLTRFTLGLCFTLSYAAVFTKTNRIARIFNQGPGVGPGKTRYTSPGSQLVITALLTCVEVAINVAWLTWRPATVTYTNPSRGERHRICAGLENTSYLVGLAYPLLLVGLCMIYAVKTRKCPGGFNETRHIAFTTYTVTVIWLAFVPLYLASTSTALRTVILAISLSLSGLVQLGCLFFPKVYIVLYKPEKNTKEGVMMPQRFTGPLIKQRPVSGCACETDGLSKNDDSHIRDDGHISVAIPSPTPASTRSTSCAS